MRVKNEANLLAKNFAKAMKLSGFSYRMGKAKEIKVGQEEGKAKYVVVNPPPRSPSL